MGNFKAESSNPYGRAELSLTTDDQPPEKILKLLERHAIVNEKDKAGRTALSWAAEKGRVNMVQILIEYGAQVDGVDYNQRSPLSWAVEGGSLSMVKLLIDKGANINLEDKEWGTPLMTAEEIGHGNEIAAVIKFLKDHSAKYELQHCWFHKVEHNRAGSKNIESRYRAALGKVTSSSRTENMQGR